MPQWFKQALVPSVDISTLILALRAHPQVRPAPRWLHPAASRLLGGRAASYRHGARAARGWRLAVRAQRRREAAYRHDAPERDEGAATGQDGAGGGREGVVRSIYTLGGEWARATKGGG
eukprot:scaffold24274_cov146-Isochrysis_galbana.AAC.5